MPTFGRKVPHLWYNSHTSFKVRNSRSPGPLMLTLIVQQPASVSHRRHDLKGQGGKVTWSVSIIVLAQCCTRVIRAWWGRTMSVEPGGHTCLLIILLWSSSIFVLPALKMLWSRCIGIVRILSVEIVRFLDVDIHEIVLHITVCWVIPLTTVFFNGCLGVTSKLTCRQLTDGTNTSAVFRIFCALHWTVDVHYYLRQGDNVFVSCWVGDVVLVWRKGNINRTVSVLQYCVSL